jgi:Cu(I)/Ag(I) efflux system membrane fusion protein
VRSVEAGNKVQPRFTLSAPISGVIAELGVREGMTVAAGALLFRINGLGSVWIYAEVPENRAGSVRPGGAVEAHTPALPGQIFKGRVAALLPEVNAGTRTIKARIEVANPGGRLTPGMFASVDFAPAVKDAVLLVPSEAVIQTGQRKVVIVQLDDGKFQPTDVDTGVEAGGQTEIRKGLTAGQKVVISSQFLIDSEASLKGVTTRMSAMPAANDANIKVHHGDGKIEAIGKEAVTISHGPIASLHWGPMTMEFKLPATGLPANIAQGRAVAFEFRQRKDDQFELTTIAPVAPAAKASQQ